MVKVMVVDDEMPIRQWLEFIIRKFKGYQVVAAAGNGAEGYSLFKKTLPDIIITDIRMPVMDGLEMLKMIQTVDPGVRAVVLTSHEEFEYARQAIKLGASEYILKTEITEDSLKELLDKNTPELQKNTYNNREKSFEEMSNRNHFLRSLVLQSHTGSVSDAMLKEYDIPLERSSFIVLDVMTRDPEPLRVPLGEAEVLVHMIKLPLELNHTLLIGNISGQTDRSQKGQMERIQGYCRSILNQISCKIGCSDIYDSLNRLGEAMRQARDRVSLSFYYPRESLFWTEKTGRSLFTEGEKYKICFSRELINQNFKKAMEIKEEMMREVRKKEVADIDYVKKLYTAFFASLMHTTRDDAGKIEEGLHIFHDGIQEAVTLDEMDGLLEREFERYGAETIKRQEYSASVRGAVHYMEEHYAESITLSDVSNYVSLSAEYLSRIFREETGIKFVVYLNNLRLKHALQLLETTNLKVYEVAERVGYSNLSYFSTVFKKNFGQNPFDYKNQSARP